VRFLGISGGARILFYGAAQDWLPEDSFAVDARNIGVAIVVSAVGDALSDALMRPAVLQRCGCRKLASPG
jgi:hypothetical protein